MESVQQLQLGSLEVKLGSAHVVCLQRKRESKNHVRNCGVFPLAKGDLDNEETILVRVE